MGRFSSFLSDYLLLCAYCIFLVSILNPFLVASYYFSSWGFMPVIRNFSVTYWSYKAFSNTEDEFFLSDYWFNDADPALADYLGISWVLVAIFLLQILTLISGIISLLKIRKIRIIPLVSSVIIVLLMIQVYAKTSEVGLGLKTYQLGYWLTYPSIFLFLSAIIFHLYSNREKSLNAPAHALTQLHSSTSIEDFSVTIAIPSDVDEDFGTIG